jgi:hypothetical protein
MGPNTSDRDRAEPALLRAPAAYKSGEVRVRQRTCSLARTWLPADTRLSSVPVSTAARRHGPSAGADHDRLRRAGLQLGARHPQLLGRRGLRRLRAGRRRRARAALPLPPQVRARRRGRPEHQGGGVGADDAAHGHVRVQGRAAHAAGRRRRCLGDGSGDRGWRLLGVLPCLITLPDEPRSRGIHSLYLRTFLFVAPCDHCG